MAEGDELDPYDPHNEAEIPVADILSYLRRRKYNCEICDTSSWFTPSAPGTTNAISHISKPAFLNDEGYDVITYPVACIECGNTKFMNKVIIKYELQRLREEDNKKRDGE
ncbi:hypothetical protein MKK67_07150 [Methylobacterium sp. J-072]|uniref:hypothetical protein n=1 Tax=Methylobacterium sp. J-072 TaxID=2836651 RepID=UPI001FBAC5B5|nr:hypothetical protein [Methylobacterium sp. J-072]MCJ2092271.1 hypothetical protein [Methylobacterium sp. J-072]